MEKKSRNWGELDVINGIEGAPLRPSRAPNGFGTKRELGADDSLDASKEGEQWT